MHNSRTIAHSLASAVGRRACLQVVVLLAIAACASGAAGQTYKTDPVDVNARQFGVRIKSLLTNPAEYATNKANFAEYFQKYLFPNMTQTDAQSLAALGDQRFNLFQRVLWPATNEELQRDLSNLTFSAMGRIATAEPPYHPAVRYNAILIIGMLDDQYAIEGRRPPKPMAKATTALTKIVDSATTSDRFPPSVILGALIGLERHARFHEGIAPDAVEAMSAALLKFITHKEPIQGMDPEAYAWLQLRAASALAQLGSVGANNANHEALLKLVAEFESMDDRCATAALFNKLSYEGAKIDGAKTAEPMLKLARDLATIEARRADDFNNAGGQSGGGIGAPQQAPMFAFRAGQPFPRRDVLARLNKLRSGLNKLKPAVSEDSQKKFDAVLQAIEPVRVAAANENLVDYNVTAAIKAMASAIDAAVGPAEGAADEEEIVIGAPPAAAPQVSPAVEEAPPAEPATPAEQ